ncbi:MAG: hypothetical protein ACRCTL_18155 [Pseudomonas sp.]
MENHQWREALAIASRILGKGYNVSWASESWCSFTTFTSLSNLCVYWQKGVPSEADLLSDRTRDGGLWMQSFYYSDLAHIIFPAKFYWEKFHNGEFTHGEKIQDIGFLSKELEKAGIHHRLTDLILEIKAY